MKPIIHASAPYIAVLLGLYLFKNAWIAILLYHLQAIVYLKLFKADVKAILFQGYSTRAFLIFALPLLLFGPTLLALFPHILAENITMQQWLYERGLNYPSFLLLIPYFCIIHPVLEEIHWGKFRSIRECDWKMDFLFAGYHTLVLAGLLKQLWLVLSFFALATVSFVWRILHQRLKGGAIPFWSHVIADAGIIWASYCFAFK